MKHLKHLLTAALAMFVALVVATPAWAASITITPQDDAVGTNKAQYEYYELLHASIDGDKVSYYLENETDDDLRALLDAVTVDGSDLFTFTQSADGTRWIATINKKADDTEYSDSDGAKIAAALNTDAIKNAAIVHDVFDQPGGGKAEGLENGYYLVTSTLGTSLVLQTLNEVTIQTKNDDYTSGKTASKNNMSVGDIVTYTVTVAIPTTAKAGDVVTVHDTLDEHLALKTNTIAATCDGADVTLEDGTPKQNETFAKKFTVTAAMIGKTVTVTYDAELLSTAADDTGYVNDAYADTPSYETVPTRVNVYTFDFDLNKTFAGETSDEFSAKFKLYPQVNNAQGTTAIEFVAKTGNDGVTNYVKADSDDTGKTSDIIAKNAKQLNVSGLAAGTYYLVEQETEDGFNLLTSPAIITITDTSDPDNDSFSHTVSYTIDGQEGTGTVNVVNQSGTVLPSTGGIGTTIFYIVGGVMIVGAIIALITKKRVNSLEK